LEGGSKRKDSLGKEALTLVTKLFHSPLGKAAIRVGTAGALDPNDLTIPVSNGPMPSELLSDLREKLEQLLKQEGRVVFFVDDLDRIPPFQAVTLLETIKIFLNVHNVVFVLALDYEVVERGLKEKFNIDPRELGGRSFFDKLIQLPFSIPVGSYKVRDYLRSSLVELGYLDILEGEGLGQIVPLVERSVGRNPRAIKRILNSLHLLRLIKEQVGEKKLAKTFLETPLDALEIDLAILCLQSQFEPIYNWLSRSGTIRAALLQMMDRESQEDADSETDHSGYRLSLNRMFQGISDDRNAQERARYETFKDTFLRVIGIGEDADAGETDFIERRVEYLTRALDLTRVTSSNVEPTIDTVVRLGATNQEVRKALREMTQSTNPNGFWARMTSLHEEISAEPSKPIRARQKDKENSIRFQFRLRRLPADVAVRIADDRADVWLEFDGRHLRRNENRTACLALLQSCEQLSTLEIVDLTTDIIIRSIPFPDGSAEAVRAREPLLIKEVVEFLARLHQELSKDQL